jgi:hypothetical protein
VHTNIKNFEDACTALGLDASKVIPDFSGYPAEDQAAMIAHSKLVIVAKALNGDWKPNWNDGSQHKYYPYFDMRNGLSYYGYFFDGQCSSVGSRLCFRSSEIAEYAGTQFLDIYKAFLTI